MKHDKSIQIFVIFILIVFFLQTFSTLLYNTSKSVETPSTNITKFTFTGSSIANATITYVMNEMRFNSNISNLKKNISAIDGVEWVLDGNGRYMITITTTADRNEIYNKLKALDKNGSVILQAYVSVPKNMTFTSFTGENRSDISLPDRISATLYNASARIGDVFSFKIIVDVKNGVYSQAPVAIQQIVEPQLNILLLNAEGNVLSFDGYSLVYDIEWDDIPLVNLTAINTSINYPSEIDFQISNLISFVGDYSNITYLSNISTVENASTAYVQNMTNKSRILEDIPSAIFSNSTLNIMITTQDEINISDAENWAPGRLSSIYRSAQVNASKITGANQTFSTDKTFPVLVYPETQLNGTVTYILQALLMGDRIISGRGQEIKTIPK